MSEKDSNKLPKNLNDASSSVENSSEIDDSSLKDNTIEIFRHTLKSPLYFKVYFIALIVVLLILVGVPIYNILSNYNLLLERQVSSLPHIDDWDKRIVELEKKLQLLTTASIDGRLQKVESLLDAGSFSKEDLQNIQQISMEVKKIKNDLYISPQRIGEFRELQYKFDLFEQKVVNRINDTKTTLMWFIMASICLPFILLFISIYLQHRSPKESQTRPIEDKQS